MNDKTHSMSEWKEMIAKEKEKKAEQQKKEKKESTETVTKLSSDER